MLYRVFGTTGKSQSYNITTSRMGGTGCAGLLKTPQEFRYCRKAISLKKNYQAVVAVYG